MSCLDAGRIGIASQALGIAQAALDAAIGYAKQREQFGKKLASFQGLRWMLVDMSVAVEAARLLTWRAAMVKDSGKRCTFYAAQAKLFASETANHVANKSVQIHGGYGYIKEYPVERHMRDARVTEIYEGTSQIQRLVIAASMLKEPALVTEI
jgi:butyryl-CoA dehydrogenase